MPFKQAYDLKSAQKASHIDNEPAAVQSVWREATGCTNQGSDLV
jgi:hypothetical protein